jgi:cytochrome c peroxidase
VGRLALVLALILFPLAGLAEAFDEDDDVAEVLVGGRLFLETRFAHHFFAHHQGRVNEPLPAGDPVMERSVGVTEDLPGPFAGRSMNCRACHLVNEHQSVPGGSIRTYTDYARHSPIPARSDGATRTPRRSPILVNATLPRSVPLLLHADGEFASIEDLVRGTLTGRNFGWLPEESALAVRHIATIIRRDDGTDEFAKKTARLSYAMLLRGRGPGIAPFVQIPEIYRLDVDKATDVEILNAVAKLIGAYVDSLQFGVFKPDHGALYVGSPYDAFLVKNSLPLRPDAGESALAYARRLRERIAALTQPAWIGPEDWGFKLHRQTFQFGPRQLEGLKIFLAEPTGRPIGRVGNCVACHTPPAFTDGVFHNNGAAQDEYDEVHGDGAFAALKVPTRAERAAAPDRLLSVFRAIPSLERPGLTDLGLWNIFENDQFPSPQKAIREILGVSSEPTDADLARTLALFKTPTVRDPGQTGPYFHTGRKDGLDAVLRHYLKISELARANRVRNADPKLRDILVAPSDLDALQAFLRALNEDYND